MSANVRPGDQLSPKQDAFLVLLLAGVSIVAAAAQVDIAEKTAHKWLKLAHFQAAYRNAQKAMFNQALNSLMSDADIAVKGIKDIAKDETVPANFRLRAYQIWLEQAIAIDKVQDLESRLADLENQLQERGIEGNGAIRRVK